MNVLLRLKHWQIFVLVYGWPWVVGYVITHFGTAENQTSYLIYKPYLVTLSALLFLVWLLAVAIKLRSKLLSNQNADHGILLAAIVGLFCLVAGSRVYYSLVPSSAHKGLGILLAIFVILLIIASWFFAKLLASAERDRRTRASDEAKYFFGLIVFPVGVWFIQPKVNDLISDNRGSK